MYKIMLIGGQRAGKDTAANYLWQFYGIQPFALAQGIYEIAEKYFGVTYKNRELLINIGEKMRELDPLVWVKYTLREIQPTIDDGLVSGVLITDVRMPIEYSYLMNQGFVPVFIDADLSVRRARAGFSEKYKHHYTEPVKESFPHLYMTIENNGSILEFEDKLDELMDRLEEDFGWN